MLMMKCRSCGRYIHSTLLAEVQAVHCDHCQVENRVQHVLVTANGLTFARDDLRRCFYRYRKLLDEVKEEYRTLNRNPAADPESQRSVKQLLDSLKILLAGAREKFRYSFTTPVSGRVDLDRIQCDGRFANLSLDGACLAVPTLQGLPRVGDPFKVRFDVSAEDCPLEIYGRVCWVRRFADPSIPTCRLGVKFMAQVEDQQVRLRDYIFSRIS